MYIASHFCAEKRRCFLLKAATTFTAGLSLLLPKSVSDAIQPSDLPKGRRKRDVQTVKKTNGSYVKKICLLYMLVSYRM